MIYGLATAVCKQLLNAGRYTNKKQQTGCYSDFMKSDAFCKKKKKNEEKNLQLNELFRTSCGLPLSFCSNFVASSSVS